jgi:hypothetical protein
MLASNETPILMPYEKGETLYTRKENPLLPHHMSFCLEANFKRESEKQHTKVGITTRNHCEH